MAVAVLITTLLITSDTQSGTDFVFRAVGELPIVGYFLAALGSGALYWRRREPIVVFGFVAAVSFLSVWPGSIDPLFFPFALYSLGRYASEDRWSIAGVIVALVFAWLAAIVDGEPAAETVGGLGVVFVIWYVGRRIRVRRSHLRVLQERADYLEREQAAEARRAVAEERARIARELHDVVAHRVSLMTVQAGAAKTVAGDDPDRAAKAMEAVEEAGRQALSELRHLLDVLRPAAEGHGLGPQPGLADVPALVDQVRAAGLDVSLTMDGIPADLPSQVALSAYRIVQEALTNVLKHAGTVQAEVRLSREDGALTVEVADGGVGGNIQPGSGHGIAGMRERALLLGGTLEAHSRQDGGFRVLARLPVGEEGP